MNFQNIYHDLEKKKDVTSILWRGENPYFEKELKIFLQKEMKAEIKSFQVPKAGLDPEMIEATQGGFLFSPLVALFLKFTGSVSAWKAEAQRHLKECIQRADGRQLIVVLMVPTDKRFKWDGLGCQFDILAEEVSPLERLHWANQMNHKAGAGLDSKKLDFVVAQEGDLLQLEKYIELWNLGGDSWAIDQLNWTLTGKHSTSKATGGAFDWVDFVFQKNHKNAISLVRELMNSGEDPIKLLGLISKSARILAMLEMNKDMKSQPPFLIQKLKKFKGQSGRLLSLCREADLHLKSTSVNGRAVMQRLSTLGN